MSAPDSIKQLVERFEQHRDAYRAGKYNETQLRREFLDPFFEALGWDVFNKLGYSEENKHVIHEDSLEIEGAKKAPDYAFKIGRERKFFVEAKKPSVRIETNPEVAFQLKRYVWSAKLPLGILTDFEEFAVYECRSKPKVSDSVKTGRVMLLSYTEYIEKWDEISAIFSHEAVMKGGFDQFANTAAKKKGTAEVDSAFLAEIEGWREALAKNVALRNKPQIGSEADLNYAVQMTIDRIIFLRICEDRGYESENQLQGIASLPPPSLRDTSPKFQRTEFGGGQGGGVYAELKKLFERADRRYNSGLFHFRDEKGRGRADTFTMGLEIDDKVLKDIIKDLYYPAPYVFALIPADILGQIYEQFLGKVIRLTASNQAKVEEKPEVRKAGGVFYTPTFIVDYIIINTLGKLLAVCGKSGICLGIGITPQEASLLKLLDPACGSGTFLLGAYQYLLDWHLNWYLNNDFEKWSKGKKAILVQSKDGWKLTVEKKKEILLNNIFGVDIDPQAVEVTKLSLLLKVIEDPGQLSYLDERILPDLGRNIQCGNSLIGPDYFEGQLGNGEWGMVNGEERARVNAFDWKAAFPEVFAQGGFDVVVGNPPYLFIIELGQAEKDYYFKKYKTTEYRFDVYGLFTELSVQLLLKEKGYLSFIIPHTLLSNDSFAKLRNLLLSNTFVDLVVDIGPGVFQTAKNETMVFVVRKDKTLENEKTKVVLTNSKQFPVPTKEFDVDQQIWAKNKNSSWLVKVSGNEMELITKFESASRRFGELCTINQGARTGDNEKYLSDTKSGDLWKPAAGGKHVARYEPIKKEIYIYYDPKVLDAPRKPELFSSAEKLIVQEIRNITLVRRIVATYDAEQFYGLQSTNVINLRTNSPGNYSLKFLLGILNSSCVNYFFRQKFSGNNHIASNQLAQIPIPAAEKAQHDKMVLLVERMLALQKSLKSAHNPQEADRLMREVESTDRAIDGLVYELYGLTEEEIKIIEG